MSDLISREALIDVIEKQKIDNDAYCRLCIDSMKELIEEQPSVTDTNVGSKWIPCSYRLPEESGEYLVWYDCGEDMEGCCVENFDAGVGAFGRWCDEYDAHTLGFLDSEFIYFDEAVAWMPLPEPYKGE